MVGIHGVIINPMLVMFDFCRWRWCRNNYCAFLWQEQLSAAGDVEVTKFRRKSLMQKIETILVNSKNSQDIEHSEVEETTISILEFMFNHQPELLNLWGQESERFPKNNSVYVYKNQKSGCSKLLEISMHWSYGTSFCRFWFFFLGGWWLNPLEKNDKIFESTYEL